MTSHNRTTNESFAVLAPASTPQAFSVQPIAENSVVGQLGVDALSQQVRATVSGTAAASAETEVAKSLPAALAVPARSADLGVPMTAPRVATGLLALLGLSPLAVNPMAPLAPSPALWALLAETRRQSHRTINSAIGETMKPQSLSLVDDGTGSMFDSIFKIFFNTTPVAASDAYTTAEGNPLTIPSPGVLGNDSDVNNDTLTVASFTQPADGAVVFNPDGSFTYTPDADFAGADRFTYTVTDAGSGFHVHGLGGLVNLLTFGLLGRSGHSTTTTVTVTVTAVNDAPVAVGDTVTTDEDTPLTINPAQLLNNDYDPDGTVLDPSNLRL
ncbi:MAG: Ig-like domain-containing protein, partial [Dietzia sp.]|nr:Ig-like domain-containing protein [Dietzia sp.]